MNQKTAVIIGAGPAGLTAALELQRHTDVRPIVLEMSGDIGGIAKTVNYKGNRIDIGGHRFFSKSDRVMEWWMDILPVEATPEGGAEITYHRKKTTVSSGDDAPSPESTDLVMLVRERLSRIYFLRKFFSYPISLSPATLSGLGVFRTVRIGFSYMKALVFPIRNESNLEEFFINRFGRELYGTFFKDYTEKVWGTDCKDISAEWGAQRIKGLSVTKAITHFVGGLFKRKGSDVNQKDVETSLIERFLYPKHGPGQLWEEVARQVVENGGEVRMHSMCTGLRCDGNGIRAIEVTETGEEAKTYELEGDYFFSTMPMKDLVRAMDAEVPSEVKEVSEGLIYRDFITVGVLAEKLEIGDPKVGHPRDNWIYMQEPDVKVGRLQIFNNWSPYMVASPDTSWVGLEYFCNEGDELWNMSDEELKKLAVAELARVDILDASKVLDQVVIRVPKTYPAYFGSYERFPVLREWVDGFENLFLVGRNGMHKYNNQDHSMLTAMLAVENIRDGRTDKSNLWEVNTEEEYHEEK